jgi:hypothetical protein
VDKETNDKIGDLRNIAADIDPGDLPDDKLMHNRTETLKQAARGLREYADELEKKAT